MAKARASKRRVPTNTRSIDSTSGIGKRTRVPAASNERYRNLFEASRDALMTLAPPNWRFTQANSAALRLFGAADQPSFLQLSPWAMSPKYQPDGALSSAKARKMLRIAVKKGVNFFEWTHQRVDGTVFYSEVLLTYIFNERAPYVLSCVRDITPRKKIEESLFENESLLSAIFDSSPDFIFLKDMSARYVKLNKGALRIMGKAETAFIGKTDTEIFGPEIAARNEKEDREVMISGKTMSFIKEMHFPSGTRHMNVIKTPFSWGKRPGILGVGRDITRLKEMESELAMTKAAESVDKLAKPLAKPLAHDFSNVLAVINGYASLLKEISTGKLGKKEVGKIIEAVERATAITEKLRSFAESLNFPSNKDRSADRSSHPPENTA